MRQTLSQNDTQDVLHTEKTRVRRKMVIAALTLAGSLSCKGEESKTRHFTCTKREIIAIMQGRKKGTNTQNTSIRKWPNPNTPWARPSPTRYEEERILILKDM